MMINEFQSFEIDNELISNVQGGRRSRHGRRRPSAQQISDFAAQLPQLDASNLPSLEEIKPIVQEYYPIAQQQIPNLDSIISQVDAQLPSIDIAGFLASLD